MNKQLLENKNIKLDVSYGDTPYKSSYDQVLEMVKLGFNVKDYLGNDVYIHESGMLESYKIHRSRSKVSLSEGKIYEVKNVPFYDCFQKLKGQSFVCACYNGKFNIKKVSITIINDFCNGSFVDINGSQWENAFQVDEHYSMRDIEDYWNGDLEWR